MLKTGLKIFIVVVAIAAIVVGYFYFFERNKNVPNALKLFANNGVVIRLNDPSTFIDELGNFDFSEQFNDADSLIYNNILHLEQLADHKSIRAVYISFSEFENRLHPAIILETYSYRHSREVIDALRNEIFQGNNLVQKENNRNIYYTLYTGQKPTIFFAEKHGIIVISGKAEFLFHQLAQISFSAKKNVPYKTFSTANSEVVANCFIPTNLFENPITRSNKNNPQLFVVLDLYLKKDKLLLSGLSQVSTKSLGAFLAKAPSRTFDLPNVLPENIDIAYEINAENLFDSLHNLSRIGTQNLKWIKEWESNKIVHFKSENNYGIGIKSKGESVARNALEKYAKHIDPKITASKYKFDKETSFQIYTGSFDWVSEILPYKLSQKIQLKYASSVGGYIILTTNKQSLKSICRNTVLNQNLKSSYQFKQYEPYFSSASNLMGYGKFDKNIISDYVDKKAVAILQEFGLFDAFNNMILQVSGSGNHLYNHIVLFSKSHQNKTGNVRWKTKLKSSASMKPVVVQNHNTNEDEIFVQDQSNFIYLINKKGRILWEKQLDGQILSQVVQVDKYKNNKLQYLFNTTKRVYLIDRNGNDVERFPIKLPTNSTTGLAVFDYEKNKNYRIFIPLADKTIRLYDIDANTISGWNFKKTDAFITTPIQYYRLNNKDYIVFADSIRHYILNRKGEERVKPSKLIGKSNNNPIYFEHEKNRWISSTQNGTIVYTSITGAVETREILKTSPDHYFLFADLLRNSKGDYIFVDEKKLKVYNNKQSNVFSFEFANKITEPPAIYSFSRHKAGLGIVDKANGKVYMFNRKGKQFKGYPFQGITPFTITHIKEYKQFQLIVGNFDGFLYDYQL